MIMHPRDRRPCNIGDIRDGAVRERGPLVELNPEGEFPRTRTEVTLRFRLLPVLTQVAALSTSARLIRLRLFMDFAKDAGEAAMEHSYVSPLLERGDRGYPK